MAEAEVKQLDRKYGLKLRRPQTGKHQGNYGLQSGLDGAGLKNGCLEEVGGFQQA